MNSLEHEHVNVPLAASLQVPPLRQELEVHTGTELVQFSPVNPGRHTQIYDP